MVNTKMKFTNCLLNCNDFSSGHTSRTHHTKPGRMASIFLRRPRHDSLHTGRDAPFALQLTAGSITLQVINTICPSSVNLAKPPSQLSCLPGQSLASLLTLFLERCILHTRTKTYILHLLGFFRCCLNLVLLNNKKPKKSNHKHLESH